MCSSQARIIEKLSILRNHSNFTPTFESTRKEEDATEGRDHKVLKEDVEVIEESNDEKYCTFHGAKGHNLPKCKAFARKTLQERMQWLKKARLCCRCLMKKHLAKECKTKDKCTKCGSDRHLEMLHMEKKNQQSRVKWKERRHNLEIGDIVIMTEENHHNNWPLARVINTFQSQDGKVRKVDVITWKNGEKKSYLRPISNIVFLMSTKQ
jgi:hypothetical protein